MKHCCLLPLLFLFFCLPVQVQSQNSIDFVNYQNIKHSGKLPRDLTTSTASKYESDSRKISSSDKRSIRKAQDQFYKQSNFVLDELLASGKVFFNDPITQYVNQVADELLKDDPKLRKELKIYTVKNDSPNAFTTNDGKILVHWGLLNKLENEAQLAAILAHEIVHYRDKHVIESVNETVKIENGVGLYQRYSELDKVTARTNFSKEKEMEADMEGLGIYMESDYPESSFLEIFDVLAYAHVPFEDKEFSLDYFSTDKIFDIPNDYIGKIEYNDIEAEEEEDSDTHPGLTDRKVRIFDELGEVEEGSNSYLVSEKGFKEAQKMARYELSKMYLYYKDYPMSIYHSWLLLQKNPKNAYLHKNIVKGVYGIAKFKNYEEYSELMGELDVYDIEGKSKIVYELFEELNEEETSILALTLAKRYLDEYNKEDIEINRILEDLIKEMVLEHDFTANSFKNRKEMIKAGDTVKKKKKKKSSNWISKDKDDEDDEELKFDVPNSETEESAPEEEASAKEEQADRKMTFDLSFVIDNEEHLKLVEKTIKDKKKLEGNRESMSDGEYSQFRKYIDKKGFGLDVDRIAVVDPFYFKIDYRKREAVDYLAIEDAEEELVDILKDNAQKLDLKIDVLSAERMGANSAETFADMAFLKSWFSDQLNNGRVDMVSVDYERAQEISKKYKTPVFMSTGVLSGKYKRRGGILYTVVIGWLYPTIIPKFIGPKNETFFYNFIYNLEEDEIMMYDYNSVNLSDTKATLNSNIYYQLMQVKRK